MSPSGSIIKYNLDTVTVTYFAWPLHGLESQFFRQILGLRSLKLRDRECEVFTLHINTYYLQFYILNVSQVLFKLEIIIIVD